MIFNVAQYAQYARIVGRAAARRCGITPTRIFKLTGKTAMSSDQIEVLNEMRQANECAPSPFRSSEIWKRLARQFEDWFHSEGIKQVEQQEMNGFFSSPRIKDRKLLRYACWLLYQQVKSRDTLNLLDRVRATACPNSGYAFDFEGRLVSWDLLISLDTLYSIAEIHDGILSQPVVVADIGAGWGRMGYVLRIANPKLTYVVFDLPEVLLVSSTYLPLVLPPCRVLDFRQSRQYRSINREMISGVDCAFFGSQDLEKFEDKTLDIVINIASFQEMTFTQVEQYFRIIDRKLSGTLYTQQLWKTNVHTWKLGEIRGLEDMPFPGHWTQRYVRNTTWSDLYFEAAYSIPAD
jgi:putative sugar O-methyltransferase